MVAPSTLFIHVERSGRWCFYRPNGPSCHSIKAQWKKNKYSNCTHTHTHTHPFHGLFSGTTRVGQYQKGKTNLDFTEARDSERQWHQLGHMQVCTSLQTDDHASIPPVFTGRMPFLLPNQQRQSTEGNKYSSCNWWWIFQMPSTLFLIKK